MNKKKIFLISIIICAVVIFYSIYTKLSYSNCINTTIKYENKINYSTNINLVINNDYSSSKLEYDVIKSSNIKKISITNYQNEKLVNNLNKYVIKKNKKEITYVYDGISYKKEENSEDFNVDYNLLKKAKVKSYFSNKFVVLMDSSDAYNLIYSKKLMTKNDLKGKTKLIIMKDKNNFIKEITYNINNINNTSDKTQKMTYNVKIINRDINNQNSIKIPFKLK